MTGNSMTGGGIPGGYLRYPAIAGGTVVFCCEDDLWTVPATGGQASRLTAGTAESSHPRVSPDGELIAFVGAADGPAEVCVMPFGGGSARRLTFDAERVTVAGWIPGTRDVVFASMAGQPAGFGFRLFTVPAGGGPTRLLTAGPATAVAFSPGGAVVIGRNIADPARRKRYRGGAAGDLWIDPDGSGIFRKLPGPAGNLANPCWVGDRIYFISDHAGNGNVYSCRPDGTGRTQHTDHSSFYARNLSADGSRLVYQAGARLHLLDPETGRSQEIPVELAARRDQHGHRCVPAADFLTDARLSPDGASLAVVTRGKASTLAHWTGPVRRHGLTGTTRYRQLDWLADGRRLVAVASDERPEERLALLPADGGVTESEIPLTDAGYVTELLASPSGGRVAFATNRQQLWVVDTSSVQPEPVLLDSSPHDRIEHLAWSPDGRWLAYTYPDTPRTSAIKVAEPGTGETFGVTHPVLRDMMPAFDPAGRYLYFIGQRDLQPEPDQVQFGVSFPFGNRPYAITLQAGLPAPFARPALAPGAEPEAPASEDPVTVEIDLAGIDRRVVPFPVPLGRYGGIAPLSGSVLLLTVPVEGAKPDGDSEPDGVVSEVDLATGEVTDDRISPVDELQVNAAAGVVLYRSGKRLRVLAASLDGDHDEYDFPQAPASVTTGWVDLERIQVPVRPADEWLQMYREAWRLQRESFWNAGMSGVDWEAMYRRYLPLAGLVATRSELSDLFWELQGELGTSHAYEFGGDYRRGDQQSQGFLGVDWAPGEAMGTGNWRIGRILRGDPWRAEATSPCNRPGTDIQPGDVLEAVNGQPVGPAGPGELLVGQAGREVELTLVRPGAAARRVTVATVGSEAAARYRDWVEHNRAFAHAASAGRIGYLHVPDMRREGYAEFVRAFLTELDREGLVVDVRFNGGGQMSPLLLDRLARRRAGAEYSRWNGATPYPLEAPAGPMAALVNHETGSDAEIFSHMFRVLGLGPLVGNRTWGGTIATWPRHELVDGTVTTQPEFCYFFRDVGDSLENRGVEPDLVVEVPPAAPGLAADPQLAAAVQHLLAGLPVAGEPAGVSHAPALSRAAAGPAAAASAAAATRQG